MLKHLTKVIVYVIIFLQTKGDKTMEIEMYQVKICYEDITEEHYYNNESEAIEVLKDLLMYYNQYEKIEVAIVTRDVEKSCFEDISRKPLYTIVNTRD